MSFIDWIKDLLGNHSEHVQNISDTVQNLGGGEVAENVQGKASEITAQAGEVAGGIADKGQDILNNSKDKLGL
jgi:hypothetical protein